MPTVPLKPGFFSDTGYRFRENVFEMTDSWIPGVPGKVKKFYDVTLFNSDTVSVDSDYMGVAELYFRIDIDVV